MSALRFLVRILPASLLIISCLLPCSTHCVAATNDLGSVSFYLSDHFVQQYAPIEQLYNSGAAQAAWDKISALPENTPAFHIMLTNGLPRGWLHFHIKQRIALSTSNHVEALRAARMAEGYLSLAQPPGTCVASTVCFAVTLDQALAATWLGMAQAARAINKNFTCEAYARMTLALTNVPDYTIVSAALELAHLYLIQGRHDLAYALTTNLYVRVPDLPKDAFVVKADAALWRNKDREAFRDLLTLLYTDQLQKEQPWDDPALRLFLKRIGRATDTEIAALYDALDLQLQTEQLLGGREPLLAFLIQERMLLAKVFPFLASKDDLSRFLARLESEAALYTVRTAAFARVNSARGTK